MLYLLLCCVWESLPYLIRANSKLLHQRYIYLYLEFPLLSYRPVATSLYNTGTFKISIFTLCTQNLVLYNKLKATFMNELQSSLSETKCYNGLCYDKRQHHDLEGNS